mgnify:CR=1 FL=1
MDPDVRTVASIPPTLAIHEYCALLPTMDEAAIGALAADIKANGLREEITLFHGQVVDGRNRLRACGLAGVEPRYVEYAGRPDDLLVWIASRNLYRRHLSPSQQALVGAEIVHLLKATTGRSPTADVAARIGIHQRYVQYAGKVLERAAPELIAAVREDRVSVQVADKIATLPAPRQRVLVEEGPQALFAEYRRMGGRIWRSADAAPASPRAKKPAPAVEREWDRLTTSFGVPLRTCDLTQVEAELARLPKLQRLHAALRDRLAAAGTVESAMTAAEFAQMWKRAQA